ncbi:zinc finger protein 311 isoform X1 [Amyelois transitella]|uniref:zinc finger protein 311 isoform X1 n=1 Tax=Amyelois transitella TaxID=680683 RepID=UPI00298FD798|nr:zinc finger protein 311 isoform X1 [Amyelois transitella]
MPREIDVKALVSHIVLGNGMDKCRICMGDTTEGQVHLGDTVMTDGERPVTLSELLEIITGVEVQQLSGLPPVLCSKCSHSAIEIASFTTLCRDSVSLWENITAKIQNILPKRNLCKQTLAVLLDEDKILFIENKPKTTKTAVKRLTEQLAKDKVKVVRQKEEYAKSQTCECPNCGKKFHYARSLFLHLKESSNMQRACHICAGIMSRDELVRHLVDVHDREAYDCDKCPALFRTYSQFEKHQKRAHSGGVCTCGDCGRSFPSNQAYNAHLTVHILKTCPGCDSPFRNHSCYLHHVKRCCNLDKNRNDTYHTKHKVTVEVKNKMSKRKIRVGMRGSADTQCVCDYCGKKFAGKKFVGAHIKIVHLKNTHKPCIYCGKLLAAAHMTEHVKIHLSDRSYKCEYCAFILKSKLGYIQHLRLHTGEKPYACKHCGEKFSASSRRSEHIRKIHSMDVILNHACQLCPAKFRLPYKLRRHMTTVHNQDESLILFECNVCHEKFSSCRGLLHHSRKHQKVAMNNATEVTHENIGLVLDSVI